jgi:hypothetical protein
VSTERDGEHDVGVWTAEVLSRQPEVRETPPSSERDLALRRAYLEWPEFCQALTDPLEDRAGDLMPSEEVLRLHLPSVSHPTVPERRLDDSAADRHLGVKRSAVRGAQLALPG